MHDIGDAPECDMCYDKRMREAKGEWESLGKPEPTRENLEYSNALDSSRLKESI